MLCMYKALGLILRNEKEKVKSKNNEKRTVGRERKERGKDKGRYLKNTNRRLERWLGSHALLLQRT